MKIERQFTLAAPLDVVWASLKDSRAMAQCLPGAEVEEDTDPDHLKGRLNVRLGPIVASFDGTVSIVRDETACSGTMRAAGVDRRTRTRVRADISYLLCANEGETVVTLHSDFSLAGALAQFARKSLIDKVANELIEGFSDALQQRLRG